MRISHWNSDVCSSDRRDGSADVQCYGHSCSRDALDRAQRAVLDAHAAFVSQKHDPVALGKIALAPLRLNGDVFAQLVTGAHPVAGSVVERPHLVVGVGEDNATVGRCGLPLAIPALDQLAACALARLGRMDEAVLLIRSEEHTSELTY